MQTFNASTSNPPCPPNPYHGLSALNVGHGPLARVVSPSGAHRTALARWAVLYVY
jgi:hypothetical protein